MFRLLTPSPRQRGFSLIEVVVTVAVMALMMALAMPEAVSWIKGVKVRNAAESVRSGIERARMEALKTNGTVGFWIVSDSSNPKVPGDSCVLSTVAATWVVSVTSPEGKCASAPSLTDGPRVVQRSLAAEDTSNLNIAAKTANGGDANQVRFNGLGQVQVDANSIHTVDVTAVDKSGRRLRVVVETGGAVRMCDLDVASGDPRACPVEETKP